MDIVLNMAIALIVWTASVAYLAYTIGHMEGETKINKEWTEDICRQLDRERRS